MKRFILAIPVVVCLSVALFAQLKCTQKNPSPENPAVILGMLGAAGVTWQYFRTRR
jgi:hypothetical protein